jgi:tRNA threonylcarbamoyladenosine modification (KEOPS) complex  Pcc1 subunit
MKARAAVRLKFPSEKQLETILRSLEPEVKSPTSTRSQASLAKKRDCLILKIEAKDTVALRAALNAYLRWINSMLNVFQILEREKGRGA